MRNNILSRVIHITRSGVTKWAKSTVLTSKNVDTIQFLAGSLINIVIHKKNEDKMTKARLRKGVQHEHGIVGIVPVRVWCKTPAFSIW